MGGCRCIFRDCDVTSAHYPRMHFFHIPVNDPKRAAKWATLIGRNEEIMRLTQAQQKNRVVCARHFHDMHFMNYKKNRLDRNAIPTLMRLGPTLALDYEAIETERLPRLIKLEPSTMPHLIPPPDFECPLKMEHLIDERKRASQLQHEGKVLPFKQQSNTMQSQTKKRPTERAPAIPAKIRKSVPPEKPPPPPPTPTQPIKTNAAPVVVETLANISLPNELEVCVEKFGIIDEVNEVEEERRSGKRKSEDHVQVFKIQDIDDINAESLGDFRLLPVHTAETVELIDDSDDDILEQLKMLPAVQMSPSTCEKSDNDERCKELEKELDAMRVQLQQSNEENEALKLTQDELKRKHQSATQECRQLQKTCKALRAQVQTLQAQQAAAAAAAQNAQQQENTISTSKECHCQSSTEQKNTKAQPPATSTPTPTAAAATVLSKAQLFNGIKRYLSASMASLLRMEMFGSNERAWKPDEQRVSIDLLRLGENVYNYLIDEWRLRLPALRDTTIWLNESNSAALNDEEDDL